MKKFVALATLSVAALMPFYASAQSAELRVIGTITPSACAPNFTGGGVVDYGTIPAGTLNQASQSTLPAMSTQLTVTCDSPVMFGFSSVDERAGTAVTTLDTIPGYAAHQKFGLGAVSGTNIGAYSLQVGDVVADIGPVTRIASNDGGTTWAVFGGAMAADSSRLISVATNPATPTPAAVTTITVPINVVTAIDATSNLPLTDDVPLDGLATVELVYL